MSGARCRRQHQAGERRVQDTLKDDALDIYDPGSSQYASKGPGFRNASRQRIIGHILSGPWLGRNPGLEQQGPLVGVVSSAELLAVEYALSHLHKGLWKKCRHFTVWFTFPLPLSSGHCVPPPSSARSSCGSVETACLPSAGSPAPSPSVDVQRAGPKPRSDGSACMPLNRDPASRGCFRDPFPGRYL